MKTQFLFVVLAFFYTIASAQDTNYSGPAKSYVNSFWQSATTTRMLLEKGAVNMDPRITNMVKTIALIKGKDPAYDTTAMHTEVKLIQEWMVVKEKENREEIEQAQAQKERKAQEAKALENSIEASKEKTKKLMDLVFESSIGNHTPENIKAQTDAIRTSTRNLLSGDMSNAKNLLGIYEKRLLKRAVEAQGFYTGLQKITKARTDAQQVRIDFFMFQYYQAYWDAAQKVFITEPIFSRTCSLASEILEDLGSADRLVALAEKNYVQKVKDTRLPPAAIKDAALEKLFMDAYDKMYSESFKGKAIKAIVMSDDWQIQRNAVTGIVTGRLRKGAIVYKNAEGQCRLVEEFFIQQEWVGNSFLSTKSVYAVGKGQEMLCEHVK